MMNNKLNENPIFVLGILIYYFAACVSNDIYIPSMPYLRSVFNTDLNQVQNSMTAWYIGVCVPQLFLGPIADKIGQRIVMLYGCFIFIFASLGCLLANSISHFVIARFLQGACVSSLNISCYSTVRRYFHYHDAIKVFSWMSIVGSSAPILGPILGGYFLTLFSWRLDFLFLMIITVPAFILLYFNAPETKHFANSTNNILLTYRNILSNRHFVKNSFCYGLLIGGLIAYLTSAPYVLIDSLKIDASQFGFIQSPVFLMAMAGGTSVSYCVKWFSPQKTKHLGLLILTLAIIFMLLLNIIYSKNHLLFFIIPCAFFAFGNTLCGSILTADAMNALKKDIGAGAAIHGLVTALSGSIASWIVGECYDGSIIDVAWILIGMIGAALFFYTILPKFWKASVS